MCGVGRGEETGVAVRVARAAKAAYASGRSSLSLLRGCVAERWQ
jgi:hypothetical protein